MKHPNLSRLLLVLCCTSTLSASAMAMDKPTYFTSDGNNAAAKVVYEYKPDSLFQVNAQMGFVSDVALRKGESITYIGAGDTKRWLIDQASVDGTTHLYIKPLAAGIQTNMIVNTDTHSYRLYLVSVTENYTPIIQFSFPEDSSLQQQLHKPLPWKDSAEKEYFDLYMEKDKTGSGYVPKTINRNYAVTRHGHVEAAMYPSEIFDDGTRTYIKIKPSNTYDLPVLYNIKDNRIELVNYRIKNNCIIADRVFTKARLFFGPKTWLDIVPADSHYKGGSDPA